MQNDPLSLPLAQSLIHQMFVTGIERVSHLGAEPTHRERHVGTFDQSVIEPGRARRGDLALQSRSDRLARTSVGRGSFGPSKRRYLDDAARSGCLVEGVETAKADMMRAPIRAVDHGIGGARHARRCKPVVDQPPDDRSCPAPRRWQSP